MKVKVILVQVDDIPIGQCFKLKDEYWYKTNASHEKAGFQCVEIDRGSLAYIDKGTKVQKVEAEFQIHC